MKITLRGCNGKKREIPLEELIEIEKVFAGYPEFTHTFFHEGD